MKIANRNLVQGSPCFIVAEISANHNGNFQRALKLIRAASRVQADAVKFQAYTMEEIMALRGEGQAPPPWNGFTKRELYEKAITPAQWFPALFGEARHDGLIAFASVFGLRSLAMLESLDCPAYKIAKPEQDNFNLLSAVRATGKPVLVSGRNIYCPGGYPCAIRDLKLAQAHGRLGMSCHCPDPLIGALAVLKGWRYLEFHLTLDDGVPTLDDCVNLTSSQFAKMVSLARRAETML